MYVFILHSLCWKWSICLHVFTGIAFSSKVDQTPSDIFWSPERPAEMTCRHQITDYDTLLWYQRSQTDTELKLIGYMYFEQRTVEKPFEKHFNVSGHGKTHSTLHLTQLRRAEDSAVYYCAAYYHSGVSSISIKHKPTFNNRMTQFCTAVTGFGTWYMIK